MLQGRGNTGGLEISGREDGKLRELTPEGSFLQVLPWCGGDAAAPKKVKECDLPLSSERIFLNPPAASLTPTANINPFYSEKSCFQTELGFESEAAA